MTTRLTLICHAATPASRTAAFPADEPLDARGLAAAVALAGRLTKAGRALTSPTRRARQTAAALRLDASDEAALSDCDYGRWRGLAIAEVAAAEPEAVQAWTSDPDAAPHGGESVTELVRRVGRWLDGDGLDGRIVAVTHAAVLRAAVVHVLGVPPRCFWRIDAGPLAIADLRRNDRHWSLRLPGLAAPIEVD